MVKNLLEYDSTEGFEKQREFLQGLAKLINQGDASSCASSCASPSTQTPRSSCRTGGCRRVSAWPPDSHSGALLQLLLPFLDSKDVKVQGAVAGVIGKLAARSGDHCWVVLRTRGSCADEWSCMFIHEGAVESLAILCTSNVKQAPFTAL